MSTTRCDESIFDIPRTSQYFIHLPGAEPYFKQYTEFERKNHPCDDLLGRRAWELHFHVYRGGVGFRK